MSDMKSKMKSGVDKVATETKKVGSKAIDGAKGAAKSAGNAMQKAGGKLKAAAK